ncbi:RHS repeat-associated core domain-containing protein [Sporocytophaga myxococcoides]|uniref:RHS repeat-associated core domain-containing protein n=1 Tax=Sporocytophaga myxococcoides TaxID=153721 RepID=A0A098LFN8_9BACT|nr:RHS repeat-associated core domain-containing protein [Sporocytophaga myxococcoides]
MIAKAYNSNNYRYGFNGKEKDDELKGGGNSYDFGARLYDPRLGKWLAVDNYSNKYPSVSPYSFAFNNPLLFIDPSGDTVTVHVTAIKVGTTDINLFSSDEVSSGTTQKTKEVNVYRIDVTNQAGSTATFYYTRIAYRGDKDNPDADPTEVTFDPSEDGEIFLGKIRSRWSGTDNVLEITPMSGNREDGYDSYKGLADDRVLQNRKYVQFHLKGASDGCLLCVGSGQFETTETGQTIDNTNLKANSGDTQKEFMKKIKDFRKADNDAGNSDVIIIKVDQLKKSATAATTATEENTNTNTEQNANTNTDSNNNNGGTVDPIKNE